MVHLMQLVQEVVREVKGGEADCHGDGPFDPVHAETFIEAPHHAFLLHDGPHGAQDRGVWVARYPSCLHPPADHVQRVGGRLADEARASPQGQALGRVRLGPQCPLWGG